jgi:hypothetical protein
MNYKLSQFLQYIIFCSINKSFILFAVFLCGHKNLHAQKTGEFVLEKMYNKYNNNWYKTFTFSQETKNYKNDTVFKTSIWHEAIVFPEYFRIDIGDKTNGNKVIFVNDSMFNFSKGKLVRKTLRDDDLTFLIGGMYFLPFETVKVKMKKEGYDFEKYYETKYNGKKYFVLGASSESEKANTLWIEKKRLIVTRFIRYKNNNKEEAVFSKHKKYRNAWSETEVVFYINDKLFQTEKYFDIKFDNLINLEIFNPYSL